METSALLTAQQVANQLNISDDQVYLMLRRGDLPVVPIGRLVRVRQEDLDRYVNDKITNKK